jgi:hypothetical protein
VREELHKLVLEPSAAYLHARAAGVRTRETVTAITMQVLDAAVGSGLSKALIDVTELEGRLGILDSFLLVTEVFQRLRGKGMRRAAIVDAPLPTGGKES